MNEKNIDAHNGSVIVNVPALNVRSAPDGNVIGVAQCGDEFFIAPDQPDDLDWMKVYQGSPDQFGYVMSKYVILHNPANEPADAESEGETHKRRKR